MQCKSLGFVAILISLGLQAPVRADDLLGSAQGFAVLAGSTVTNTGSATIITGDVGVWPGSAITGFPPGTVVGTIRANDTVAQQAQSDLTVAYNTLAGMALTDTMTDIDLGGLTLGPGVYRFATAAVMSSSGLTLDGEGDPNALFVFQVGTTLINREQRVGHHDQRSAGLQRLLAGRQLRHAGHRHDLQREHRGAGQRHAHHPA